MLRAPCSLGAMRVFAQRETLALDLAELLRATHRHFEATLEVQSASPDAHSANVELGSSKHGFHGTFSLSTRAATEQDWADARLAEERGRAGGMATLAARCKTVWLLEAVGPNDERARLNLCAILAAVALGPVLPDDGATLFGVRGAMERLEKLLKER